MKNLCFKVCYSCYSWFFNLIFVIFKSFFFWRKVLDMLFLYIGIKGKCRILFLEGKINIRVGYICME